uniref:YbjN domain-containing protein n=1 Tax=Pararhizobium sp. IMCC3301 TaxID=3067904 RepID=UPI0027410298|nr:YbjN domain-containing protein [Pararhizobium sp. IMCC3301]
MSMLDVELDRDANPVDFIEQLAGLNDWVFERSGEDEITITVVGSWCDYHVSFSWMEEVEALHLACAFDAKVSDKHRNEIIRLLALVNEQLWMGHFDLWAEEGVVMFRQALLLSGGAEPTQQQLEALLSGAVEACERYYQAFQFILWAGKSAPDALAGTLFETVGEA